MRSSPRSIVVAACAALAIGCASKNAAVGTWEGMSVDQIPGAQPQPTRITIDNKNATLYDKAGVPSVSFPVTFPRANEAIITGALGMTVNVDVQPDGLRAYRRTAHVLYAGWLLTAQRRRPPPRVALRDKGDLAPCGQGDDA